MNQFVAYFKMGFHHIADWQGYDHMLFIIVLCAVYSLSEWRQVAILITAFTLGHSLTLALSALKIVMINSSLIEILIPITILCTSISNLVYRPAKKTGWYSYLLALFFGCIHGMAFSNFFNALMSDSDNILWPLFSFNVGLEVGQLLIVLVFFLLYFIVHRTIKISPKTWRLFFSSLGILGALVMIYQRI